MMEVYSKTIEVKKEDLDEVNHVNNVVFLRWVQDISKEHWESKTDEQITSKMFWVVRSHHIEYKKQVFLDDQLKIKTFVNSCKGPFSERVVEFWRADERVVTSKSNWCLLGTADQKPIRIPDEIQSLF
ncbi:MAG: thioesterase family protein [Cyclobacteriaceae bacterium]